MLTKLKTAFRVFFPRITSAQDNFENKLRNSPLINDFNRIESLYSIKLLDGRTIVLRDFRHSDWNVFEQVFQHNEYHLALSFFKLNNWKTEDVIIIDAGANVGYTSFLLDDFFHKSKIVCIEPSDSNFQILLKNISSCQNAIIPYNRALAAIPGSKFKMDNSFRDGKDWAFSTVDDTNGEIEGITINEIISELNINEISILKIDIEGAERFIFQKEVDISFLEITRLLVLEIHDEYNVRNQIIDLLRNRGFVLFEYGEMTYGINKKYIYA